MILKIETVSPLEACLKRYVEAVADEDEALARKEFFDLAKRMANVVGMRTGYGDYVDNLGRIHLDFWFDPKLPL